MLDISQAHPIDPGRQAAAPAPPDQAIDVHFGGEVEEFWDYGYHHINYKNYNTDTNSYKAQILAQLVQLPL